MNDEPSSTTSPAAQRAPGGQAPAGTGQVPAWAIWSLRALVVAGAILVLLQPVLAGRFLTGDAGSLRTHSTVAGFIPALAFFQIAAAVLVWRPGRGPAWPIWASLAFFLLTEVQVAFGYTDQVQLHIPLGVLLFGLTVAMVIATWSPKLRERRSVPHRRGTGA